MQAKITLGRRLAVFVLTVLTAVYLHASPSFAQSAVAPDGEITDLVVGRNTKGPYTLSWTELDPGTVSVMMGGRTLKKGGDYKLDTAKGVIAFDRVLVNDAIVRVSYKTTPGKSKPNSGVVDVPLTLDIVNNKDTSLNITGLYSQADPKKPDSTKTVVGLGGSRNWSSGKLSSQFLVSQHSGAANGGKDASTWDQSVLKLSSENKIGGLSLSGNLMHAGSKFVGAKEFKTDVGKEAADFAALYTSGSLLQASFKFRKSDDTAATEKGTYSEVLEQSLVLSPFSGSKLSINRNSTDAGGNKIASSESDSTSIKLEQSIGKATSAVATVDSSRSIAGGKVNEVESNSVTIKSNEIKGVGFQASANQKTSTAAGEERNLNAELNLAPPTMQGFTGKLTMNQSENAKNGETRSLGAVLNINNQPGIKAQITANQSDSSKTGEARSIGAVVDVNRVPGVAAQISASQGSTTKGGDENTLGAKVTLTPPAFKGGITANLAMDQRVTGNYGLDRHMLAGLNIKTMPGIDMQFSANQSQSDRNGEETGMSAAVKVAPPGLSNVTAQASVSQKESTRSGSEQNLAAGVNLKMPVGVNLATSIAQTTTSRGADESAVAATVSVAPKSLPVNIQASLNQRDSAKTGLDNSLTTAITLNPLKTFSIKGDLTSQESTKKGLSEKTNVSMSLKSGFALITANMSESLQNTNEQYSREINLSGSPFAFAKIVAQLAQKGNSSNEDIIRAAMLELVPFSHTRLRTGLRYVESTNNVLKVQDYGLETSPWKFLSLSGNFRDRDIEVGSVRDTMNANIALKPHSALSLSGEVSSNPEDAKTGAVQPVKTAGLGMNWRIGSVGLVAKHTARDEYMANKLTDETKLGVELKAFGSGKLTTDVQLARVLTGSEFSTRTYSLGYKQSVGSDFSLSLSSYYKESVRDKVVLDDKTEVGAQASLSIKW